MAKWKPMKRHPNIYEYPVKNGKKYGIRFTYYDAEHKRREYKKVAFVIGKKPKLLYTNFKTILIMASLTL